MRCGGSREHIFDGMGALYQVVTGEEGVGPKRKSKLSWPGSISCAWLHMCLNDNPGGWWGDGSGGGCARSDAGGGLVLLVLTWYLFFPYPFPHSLFLSSLFLTSPSHPLRPMVGLASCPVCLCQVVVK